MVSFGLSFRAMLTEDIVEDKGALWTEGKNSWLSINIGSYNGQRVKVVDGACLTCAGVGVLLGAAYFRMGSWSVLILWARFRFYSKQNSKPKKQDFIQTYILLTIENFDHQSA